MYKYAIVVCSLVPHHHCSLCLKYFFLMFLIVTSFISTFVELQAMRDCHRVKGSKILRQDSGYPLCLTHRSTLKHKQTYTH